MRIFRRKRVDIPALSFLESAGSIPRATLDGSDRALIENHTGIIEYTSEKLRLSSKHGEITVTGADIALSQVRSDSLIATGRIDSVSMPGGGMCDG